MRLTVVGASGFIGATLLEYLAGSGQRHGLRPLPVVRRPGALAGAVVASLDDLSTPEHAVWQQTDTLLYLAGVAHNKAGSDDTLFDQVNHLQMMRVMRAAHGAGVRSAIYLSSIGVHGSHQQPGELAWTEETPYRPYNAYAQSKVAAEQSLRAASLPGMNVAVVRPPMVYGHAAPANFQLLRRLVATGLPLPFGSARNRRSFIGVRNLCDFLAFLARHQPAGHSVYVVSDGPVLSTGEFVGAMQTSRLGAVRQVAVPSGLLKPLLGGVGRAHLYHQLWGDLEVDSSRARHGLGWQPPYRWQDEITESMR